MNYNLCQNGFFAKCNSVEKSFSCHTKNKKPFRDSYSANDFSVNNSSDTRGASGCIRNTKSAVADVIEVKRHRKCTSPPLLQNPSQAMVSQLNIVSAPPSRMNTFWSQNNRESSSNDLMRNKRKKSLTKHPVHSSTIPKSKPISKSSLYKVCKQDSRLNTVKIPKAKSSSASVRASNIPVLKSTNNDQKRSAHMIKKSLTSISSKDICDSSYYSEDHSQKSVYEESEHNSEVNFLNSNRYLDPANKHAYVTSIIDENQIPFALVLSSLILQTRTYAALIILIGEDFSGKAKLCLREVYDKVVTVKKDKYFPQCNVTEYCWEAFVKIHCWALIEYKKCVYLDVDCLLLKNVDELFQCEEISAAPSSRWSDFFSTGVFTFQPSEVTFQSIANYVMNFKRQDETEETIINSFFYNWSQDDSKRLSQLYNVDANCNPKIIKRYKSNIRIFRCSDAWTYWMQEEEKPISENGGTIIVSLPAYSYQTYLLKWFVALFENEYVYKWISSYDNENSYESISDR